MKLACGSERIEVFRFVLRHRVENHGRLVELNNCVGTLKFRLRRKPEKQIVKRGIHKVESVHVDVVVHRVEHHSAYHFINLDFIALPFCPAIEYVLKSIGLLHFQGVTGHVAVE